MPLETLPHACLILLHEFPKLPSIHPHSCSHSHQIFFSRIQMVLICQGLKWQDAFVPQFGFSFRS